MTTEPALQVSRRPRLRLAAWAVALGALLAVLVWYAMNPPALPVDDDPVTGSTPVGQPVYLGVFLPGPTLDRELRVSGVKVHVVSDVPVQVRPLICVGGSISVTSSPDAFCPDLVEPDGRTMSGQDALVLEVTGEQPGNVSVERVRIGYRDGLRAATQPAGRPARVTILGR